MLRTTTTSLRHELAKASLRSTVRINVVRCLGSQCLHRRHQQRPVIHKDPRFPLQPWQQNLRYYADYPDHIKVLLPALSPTMETGTIISWQKKEGDKLNEGDLLAEIETDKATMGFETPEEGYLAKILVPAGEKNVAIGRLVCIIVADEGSVAAFKDFKDDGSAAAAPKPSPAPPAPAAPAAAPPPSKPAAPAAISTPSLASSGDRVYASPLARRLAAEQGLSLQVVLICGVAGNCRKDELTNMKTHHIEEHGNLFLVKIPGTETTKARSFTVTDEFYQIIKRYQDLRPPATPTDRFFLNYKNGKCTQQAVGKNKLGSMAKEIATYLKLPDANQYTGHCFRRTSASVLIDSGANMTAAASGKRKRAEPAKPVEAKPTFTQVYIKEEINDVETDYIQEYIKKELQNENDRDPFEDPTEKQLKLEDSENGLKGSGLFGSVTSKDLAGASPAAAGAPVTAGAPAAVGAPAGVAVPGGTDIPVSNIRGVIAKRLLESKQTIPHYYLTMEVRMDEALSMRQQFNKLLEKEKIKLSVNDLIIKGMAMACKKVPEGNSAWLGDKIRQYDHVDVSVAVSTESGLITPIVFGADVKGIVQISNDVKALAAKAREGKLQPHEFQGGTITVSNLGMFGIKNFSAIINPPQSIILAVGTTEARLIPADNEKGFTTAQFMCVTASCDHRTVDGAVGAQWLTAFKNFMENPTTMLLYNVLCKNEDFSAMQDKQRRIELLVEYFFVHKFITK